MSRDFSSFAVDRVIVMAAPNGARRTHRDHPALPITATELAENAVALRDAGVSVLHLHVRDDRGGHTLDPGKYREALAAIRERIGDELVLQVTTEAVGMYTALEQMAVVRELRPEAVSLALKEICPPSADEAELAEFFAWMREAGVWPQIILYSIDDLTRFDKLRTRGIFADDAPFVLFVLGNYADAAAGQVEDLDALLAATDSQRFPWAVCCFGPHEHAVMQEALARGGHVRIGFENNLLLADGSTAPDNAALIQQFVAATADQERRPATVAEVRAAFAPSPRSLS